METQLLSPQIQTPQSQVKVLYLIYSYHSAIHSIFTIHYEKFSVRTKVVIKELSVNFSHLIFATALFISVNPYSSLELN